MKRVLAWLCVAGIACGGEGDDTPAPPGAPGEMWMDAAVPATPDAGALGDASTDAEVAPRDDSLATALDVTRPPWKLAKPTPYVRLQLARAADGKLRLLAADKPTIDRQPVPSLAVEYLAVAYAGERVVASVPVRFPRSGHLTSLVDGKARHEEFTVTEGMAVVWLDADEAFDRVSLLARDGSSSLELSSADIDAAAGRAVNKAGPGDLAGLRALYPSIVFLTEGQEDQIPDRERLGETLVTPDPRMRDVLVQGLAHLGPLVVNGVSHLAWARFPASQQTLLGKAVGATVYMNEAFVDNPFIVQTVVHECMHVFANLVEAAAGMRVNDGQWPPAAVALASDNIDRFRLTHGLASVWRSLHESGQKRGYTGIYLGDAYDDLAERDAPSLGFASAYGSKDVQEDMAEYVGTTSAPTTGALGVCPLLSAAGKLEPVVAIPYAKLVLLHAVGALSETSFDGCVGSLRLDRSRSGIRFPDAPTAQFEGGLRAGVVSQAFRVLADGPSSYRMLIEVPLASAEASPLGLHRLDDVWLPTLQNADNNGVYLANDNVDFARASAGGLVLVTEASKERTVGAVFGLVLQNGFGLVTDRWTYGSFVAP